MVPEYRIIKHLKVERLSGGIKAGKDGNKFDGVLTEDDGTEIAESC